MNQDDANIIAAYLCRELYDYTPSGPIVSNMAPDAQMAYSTAIELARTVATWTDFDRSDYNEAARLIAYAAGIQVDEEYDFHTDYRPTPQRILRLAYKVVAKMMRL
jgi:hypothetical protein